MSYMERTQHHVSDNMQTHPACLDSFVGLTGPPLATSKQFSLNVNSVIIAIALRLVVCTLYVHAYLFRAAH